MKNTKGDLLWGLLLVLWILVLVVPAARTVFIQVTDMHPYFGGFIKFFILASMVKRVDWYSMVSFSWFKSCIFIWMPCHTVVFLLPPEYTVLASAFLSILLGVLVAVSKKNITSKKVSVNA